MSTLSSTALVYVLLFEGLHYQVNMGEFNDRESCRKAGAFYKEHAEVILNLDNPEWKRPLHFGCWPQVKLTLE